MPRTISIGSQDFETIITNHYFYIDKTSFIKEWWENAQYEHGGAVFFHRVCKSQ